MNALVLSLIRTWVPVAVGAVLSWLITLGITIPTDERYGFTTALTALVIGVYYAIVRVLETKFPQIGILLGAIAEPAYSTGSDTAVSSGDVDVPSTGEFADDSFVPSPTPDPTPTVDTLADHEAAGIPVTGPTHAAEHEAP